MNCKLGDKSELTYFLCSYKSEHKTRYFLVYFLSLNKEHNKWKMEFFHLICPCLPNNFDP